jgi:hypothetical protein
MIAPGDGWKQSIDQRINEARIILLFISPHFIESRYCYEIEGQRAIERHRAGQAVLIPIILRPCDWTKTPFADFQALPRDGRPISRAVDRDEACLEVAQGVMKVVDSIGGHS